MHHDGEDRGCLQEGEFSKREEISKKSLCWQHVFWKICWFGLCLWVLLVLMQNKSNYNTHVPVSPLDVTSEVIQLCPSLCDPMDCSLPGYFVHGVFQVRTLEGSPPGLQTSAARRLSASGVFSWLWASQCFVCLFVFSFHPLFPL